MMCSHCSQFENGSANTFFPTAAGVFALFAMFSLKNKIREREGAFVINRQLILRIRNRPSSAQSLLPYRFSARTLRTARTALILLVFSGSHSVRSEKGSANKFQPTMGKFWQWRGECTLNE